MTIEVKCEKCGKPTELPDTYAGRTIRCQCGNAMTVPGTPAPYHASGTHRVSFKRQVPKQSKPPAFLIMAAILLGIVIVLAYLSIRGGQPADPNAAKPPTAPKDAPRATPPPKPEADHTPSKDDPGPSKREADAGPAAPAADLFFPMGVYWPWETTSAVAEPRAEKLEAFLTQRLDDLAAHNVNLVWTVNGPDTADEIGLLCRLAAARGIRVIAGSGLWAMHPGSAKNAQWTSAMVDSGKKAWAALEGNSKPWLLNIADEPRAEYMKEFGGYAKEFADAGIPATTTVMWGQRVQITQGAPTLPYVSMDIYPFFGSPHGPRGAGSYYFFANNVAEFVRVCDDAGMKPWIMAQAYQEIWGPARQEADGSVTALAGAGTHWLMPTPAQIRWQSWIAAAEGAKGIIYFTYGVTAKPNPKADAIKEAWARKEDVATGGPMSLVSWPEYQPGPQYKAMADSYAEIKRLAPILLTLQPWPDFEQLVRPADDSVKRGHLVCLLKDERGVQYAAVVASAEEPREDVALLLSPNVARLEPIGGAPAVKLGEPVAPFRAASVALEPGQGALYRLHLAEKMKRTLLFSETFMKDDFAAKAVQAANVKAEGEAGKPRILRATASEPNVENNPFPQCGCFLLYDLSTLVPPADGRSVRLLEHGGWGTTPSSGQGVFIWAGPAQDNLAPLVSSAKPRQVVPLAPEQRFVKIGVSFRQASPEYSGLSHWSLVQWEPVR